jgi:hypothetical protein
MENNMDERDVEFAFEGEDLEELRVILQEEGAAEIGEADDSELLPGILIVVGAVIAVVALANVVIKLSRLWKHGIIVDARTDVIRTQKDPDLPRGTVIVLERDGTKHTLHEPSEVELQGIIEAAAAA